MKSTDEIKRPATIMGLDGEFTPATLVDMLTEFSLLAIERRDWMRRFSDCQKKNENLVAALKEAKFAEEAHKQEVARLSKLCREHNIDILE